jgi:hypothetical protein
MVASLYVFVMIYFVGRNKRPGLFLNLAFVLLVLDFVVVSLDDDSSCSFLW